MSKFVNKGTKMTAVLVSLLLTLNRVQHYFDVLIKQLASQYYSPELNWGQAD